MNFPVRPKKNSMFISTGNDSFRFHWDLVHDLGRLTTSNQEEQIWSGSLLPILWVTEAGRPATAIKPHVDPNASTVGASDAKLTLALGSFGHAVMVIAFDSAAVRITRLETAWDRPSVALISMTWGSDILTAEQRGAAPTLDKPFWPSWRAEGFGIAGAKTNPMQSFFRSWDFGRTDIPLGSFGPAMGSPYGAAYPRPTYSASLGGRHGWLCLGPGAIPDAALTFKVRARSAALEWLFREDLWGAGNSMARSWENPLWLSWAKNPWEAYRGFFRLFATAKDDQSRHQKTFWGTWGDFRLRKYDLPASIDRAVEQMGADLICVDDHWEEKKGSCRPHPGRFPHFAADLAHAHRRALGVGIWMPVGWLEDPAAEGLTNDDLLLNRDGVPIKSNWATDPRDEESRFFCIDPASPRAQRFLEERTQRVVREYQPSLLKIDFTYGIPGPDGCASRDPAMRGERLAWTYAKIVADAAHRIDPRITILSYSISPLWDSVQDQCALDDLGDAGMHEAAGHGQWSIWAALLGDRGRAAMASSGYHWSSDTDNLLNTAIVGAAGANLPSQLPDGTALPVSRLARRRALFKWHRKSTRWEPLWLDSSPGDLENEPTPRNWGRLEKRGDQSLLTALALREPTPDVLSNLALKGLSWSGSWAIIAQGDGSIFDAASVAIIPFKAGFVSLPRSRSPANVQAAWLGQANAEVAWQWRDGRVHLEVDAAMLASALVGFVLTDL